VIGSLALQRTADSSLLASLPCRNDNVLDLRVPHRRSHPAVSSQRGSAAYGDPRKWVAALVDGFAGAVREDDLWG
jgi:hypothetical protein